MHYVMSSGVKEKDFIVYNTELAELSDTEIFENDLSFLMPNKELKSVQEIYNNIWSCDMLFAFVIMKDGILLFSLNSEIVVKCSKHSMRFIKQFEEIQQLILDKKTSNKKSFLRHSTQLSALRNSIY
jgi:hypothetical protein